MVAASTKFSNNRWATPGSRLVAVKFGSSRTGGWFRLVPPPFVQPWTGDEFGEKLNTTRQKRKKNSVVYVIALKEVVYLGSTQNSWIVSGIDCAVWIFPHCLNGQCVGHRQDQQTPNDLSASFAACVNQINSVSLPNLCLCRYMIQFPGQVMITLNKAHTTIGLLKTWNLALCPQPPARTFFFRPIKG